MVKAAIYYLQPGDTIDNSASQLEQLRAYCDRHQLKVACILIEESCQSSVLLSYRPLGNVACHLLETNSITTLVAYKPSHLFSDANEAFFFLRNIIADGNNLQFLNVHGELFNSTELAVKQEMHKTEIAVDTQLWPPVDISLIKSRRGDANSKTEETRLRGVYFLVKQFTEEGKPLKDILRYVNESGIKTGSNKYWNIRSLSQFLEASKRKFEPVQISAELEPQLSEITEQNGISELEVYQYAKTRKQEGEVLKEIAAELNRLGSRTRSGKPWAISSVHILLEEMPPSDLFSQPASVTASSC